MQPDPEANENYQEGARDARTHINREKGRDDIHPPRTVQEQVEELAECEDGHRLRDPLGAAEAQREDRGDGIQGSWISTSQRANDESDEVVFDKIPDQEQRRRFGSGVAGPMEHDAQERNLE